MKNNKEILNNKEELDKKEINKSYLELLLEENKEMYKFGKDYESAKRKEITFSNDTKKFSEEIDKLIVLIRECLTKKDFSVLYIDRINNFINFGIYKQGFKHLISSIEMISENDLHNIYELLKKEFFSDFTFNFKHTFGYGWTLIPSIADKVLIEIDSDNLKDRNWFNDEIEYGNEEIGNNMNMCKRN